ncbi:MAG TPA: FHA domain-containing serine/threonine-protein kinase [Planctomycetota bacterium]|nr:FHA domain-containing serine/threonine-protein kinase [Planctomycetota bacterium]
MRATVILLQDDKPVSQFAADGEQPVVVGRSADSVIQIHDAKISRHHCEIRSTPDGYFVRDLGSKNGTFVNGARIAEARLRNGDRIQAGLAHLLFRCETPELAEPEPQVAPPHLCAACGRTIPLDALGAARQTQSRVYCGACVAACPLLGLVIGRYEIVQPIGKGSIGAVFKADQLSMGRLVALKILYEGLTADADAIGRFLRDARTSGQISHPNIIRIYDMNQAEGRYFISMEYAQGGDLGTLLQRQGPLPVKHVVEYAASACAALAHAHAAGIVHRNIKPSNLLLTRDGILKLADLGLAKSLHVAGLSTLSSTSSAIGAALYMAPEQVADVAASDARGDIYALGVTAYRLLTGEFPHQVTSITELVRLFHAQKIRPIRSFRDDCSAELDAAVTRAMNPEPARRFQTADEFCNAIRAAKH